MTTYKSSGGRRILPATRWAATFSWAAIVLSCSAAGGGLGGSGDDPDVEDPADDTEGVGGAATAGPAADAGSAGAPQTGEPVPAPTAAPAVVYDPNVTFQFPETTPEVRPCKAGRYLGTFDGFYAPGVAVWPTPIPVFGNIELVLDETQDGEFLAIGDGTLAGMALGLFPFEATVSGRVNCAAGKLEGGYLSDGVYIVGVLPYTFDGPITADFDPRTNTFLNGRWTVGEPDWTTHLYGGEGTWQATWTP
jgi:hypothetical protein